MQRFALSPLANVGLLVRVYNYVRVCVYVCMCVCVYMCMRVCRVCPYATLMDHTNTV